MKDYNGYIIVAIFLAVLWGIFGLMDGSGFIGGIGNNIDAIGNILSFIIKVALAAGIIWFIINIFKKKPNQ